MVAVGWWGLQDRAFEGLEGFLWYDVQDQACLLSPFLQSRRRRRRRRSDWHGQGKGRIRLELRRDWVCQYGAEGRVNGSLCNARRTLSMSRREPREGRSCFVFDKICTQFYRVVSVGGNLPLSLDSENCPRTPSQLTLPRGVEKRRGKGSEKRTQPHPLPRNQEPHPRPRHLLQLV